MLYMDSVKENLRLFNGTEFTAGYSASLGHPFFEDANPRKATLYFDGVVYPDQSIRYDLVRDEVIFMDPYKNLNIKLVQDKLSWFELDGHHFRHLFRDSNSANFPGKGYYEVLYEDDIVVYKKTRKTLFTPSRQDEKARFIESADYYVKKDNSFFDIDSKRSLLIICRDRKQEIQKFIQREKLNFKSNAEEMIVKVIDYYSKLRK